MMKTDNLNFKTLVFVTFLLTSSTYLFTQEKTDAFKNYTVKPLSEIYSVYKEKHFLICKNLENRTDLSFTEKLSIYEIKVNKLKDSFKKERKSEYLLLEVFKAKRYNCSGTHIRNITPCKPVYVKAPENMYTKEDWVNVESKDKATITLDNSFVSLSMNAIGKRTYKGVIHAKFKYKPENINMIINEETADLFSNMFKD